MLRETLVIALDWRSIHIFETNICCQSLLAMAGVRWRSRIPLRECLQYQAGGSVCALETELTRGVCVWLPYHKSGRHFPKILPSCIGAPDQQQLMTDSPAPGSTRAIALQRVSRDLWKVLAVVSILAILLLRTDLAYSYSKPLTDSEVVPAVRRGSRVLSGSSGDSEPAVVGTVEFLAQAELQCPTHRSSFSKIVQEASADLKDAPPVSSDDCAAALHLPKLALLFLTVGTMPHDKLWSDWFAAAKGKCCTLCLRSMLNLTMCLWSDSTTAKHIQHVRSDL